VSQCPIAGDATGVCIPCSAVNIDKKLNFYLKFIQVLYYASLTLQTKQNRINISKIN